MLADSFPATSVPHDPVDETADETIFSSLPSIFILNTHLSQEELDNVEDCLVGHGGNITYNPSEATLFLGKISQKKRAALELRRCDVWTDEITAIRKPEPLLSHGTYEPPLKRRKHEQVSHEVDPVTGTIDLTTDSEEEQDGVQIQFSPVEPERHSEEETAGIVTVLKLEWLDRSVAAGKPLPIDPFLIYRGRKTGGASKTTVATNTQPRQISSQILQRAKEDAASQPPPPAVSNRFQHRRSKNPADGNSSQLQLLRQTTSENDEPISIPPQPDWVRDHVPYACLRSTPLHSPNEDFISQLIKIRQIRKLTLNEVGVRAYSTSIAAIAAYPYKIRRSSEVLQLPGCDAKVANLFAEFQENGSCSHSEEDGSISAADELDTDPVLRVLNTFNDIWGVGAKTAREFYFSRGWRNLDDIVEHGWNTLSRVQQIGVKFFDEFKEGIPRSESEAIAAIVKEHANKVRPESNNEIDCILVGGYRRGKELGGDVDIILTHRDDAVTRNLVFDVAASLEEQQYITHTLSLHLTSTLREQQTAPYHDETGKHFDTLDKALVVWQEPKFDSSQHNKNPNPHRRVDIIISPWQTVGCAVLGWTGDTTFQRDLRRYVKKSHGWKFDSSGVREQTSGGQVLDLEQGGETWEAREKLAMENLGIGWRPPDQRCSR
ncbi:hypothetical protein N7533_007833 [Penicillium manginii]|uniref:uncharacterized protein n=1 Tax=Penicillium manginii TaxID=203109 RepID=UPI002549358F|nr:uncharacterized protein N7533_007833 [Penicillium manginii]KAJ5750805.1 hypothetical protein N7533_007833 [Penicillium manginii]